MDRRQQDRWPLNCAATALCIQGDHFGQMLLLHTIDTGHGGMGAVSEEPMAPGTSVTLGFESPDYRARHGVVVASSSLGDGYRLAIRFEERLAA